MLFALRANCGSHNRDDDEAVNSDDEAPNDDEANPRDKDAACFEGTSPHIDICIPRGERKALGQACKGLIDFGRRQWLQKQGMKAELVGYIAKSVSPENHLLLAC